MYTTTFSTKKAAEEFAGRVRKISNKTVSVRKLPKLSRDALRARGIIANKYAVSSEYTRAEVDRLSGTRTPRRTSGTKRISIRSEHGVRAHNHGEALKKARKKFASKVVVKVAKDWSDPNAWKTRHRGQPKIMCRYKVELRERKK